MPATITEQQQRRIGKACGETDVVQAHDHGSAGVREPPENPQHVELMLRIQLVYRFVEQEDGRILGEDRGDREPPPLTARQRCNVAVFEAGEIDRSQGTLCGCTVVRAFPGPEIEVWVTPDEHGLERRCRKRIVDQLRQQTQRACEFTARP